MMLSNLVSQMVEAKPYEAPKEPKGKICPDCKERERNVLSSGRRSAYCVPCGSARGQKWRKKQ